MSGKMSTVTIQANFLLGDFACVTHHKRTTPENGHILVRS